MRVVLDTNILLQAIARNSRLRPIWVGFLQDSYDLCISTGILLEYEEQLEKRTSVVVAEAIVSLIDKAANGSFIIVHFEWNAIYADPDDNKFFDAAVAGQVDYLVTNDSHFNEAKRLNFPKLNIVSADEFLVILKDLNSN